jgi:transcription elongation factor Elf1
METEKHMYTSETILHFTCNNCKNWWSYASSSRSQRNVTEMSCPHCGLKLKTKYNYLEET